MAYDSEDGKKLDPDAIRERFLAEYQFHPRTAGLHEIAREILRPRIEAMRGCEIIYVCRIPRLVRVEQLEVNDDGFNAVATPVRELFRSSPEIVLDRPLRFGARWSGLRVSGRAIGISMLTDRFFPDADVVDAVKVALEAEDASMRIKALLNRAA